MLILTFRICRWNVEAGPYQRDEVTPQLGPILDSAQRPIPVSVGVITSPTDWEWLNSDGIQRKLSEKLEEFPELAFWRGSKSALTFVCNRVCDYPPVSIWLPVCACTCMCVCGWMCMQLCAHKCDYMHTWMCLCMGACGYVHMWVFVLGVGQSWSLGSITVCHCRRWQAVSFISSWVYIKYASMREFLCWLISLHYNCTAGFL